jgi:hypothetical protein
MQYMFEMQQRQQQQLQQLFTMMASIKASMPGPQPYQSDNVPTAPWGVPPVPPPGSFPRPPFPANW